MGIDGVAEADCGLHPCIQPDALARPQEQGRRGPSFRLTRYKKCVVVTGRQVEKAVFLLPLAELARHAVTK